MRDDREVTIVEGESSGVKWFLLGAVLGAGLGLLFAPQSGERTRRDITRKARRLKTRAGEALEDAAEEIQDRGRRLKASVEDWAEEVGDEVRDGKKAIERTASNARDELERRLADARARRRATVAADGVADDDDDEGDD